MRISESNEYRRIEVKELAKGLQMMKLAQRLRLRKR
jgi:hypothetical protein